MKTILAIPTIASKTTYSNQNGQDYFERPKKRGNPSHADWDKMKGIIEDSIGSIPPNVDFDEISRIVEELAKINDIPLNKWAVSYFTNRILDLCCCLNYLCQIKTSDDSLSLHCLELTGNESLQLLSFNPNQFKGLTKKQQISFLLSHISLVKEICDKVKP